MEYFTLWIVMAALIAGLGKRKGYSPAAWFIYGFLLWPIALVHIMLRPKKSQHAVTLEPLTEVQRAHLDPASSTRPDGIAER